MEALRQFCCKCPNDRSCCWESDRCCFQRVLVIWKRMHEKFTWLDLSTILLKCLAIIIMLFVACWNVSKLPWYLVSSDKLPATNVTWDEMRCWNSTDFWCRGMEGSINLQHVMPAYRSGKISSHPISFLAIHVVVGATLLVLASCTVMRPDLRRKYGYSFFVVCAVFVLHTMPACFVVAPDAKVALFWADTYLVLAFSCVGVLTLVMYDQIKPHSERLLLACWALNVFGLMGAGYAEFFALFTRFGFRKDHGYFEIDSERPSLLSGHTLYDNCEACVRFGWFFCVGWIAVVWVGCTMVEFGRWLGFLPKNFWTCCFYNSNRESIHINFELDGDYDPMPKDEDDEEQPEKPVDPDTKHDDIPLKDLNKCEPEPETEFKQPVGTDYKLVEVDALGNLIYRINPESVRLIAYGTFWFMCAFAIIVTQASTTDSQLSNSPLVQTFGFNNICINWDYGPSREITAMLYPAVEIPMFCYICLMWMRKRRAHALGKISSCHMTAENFSVAIMLILCLWFRMIFVVDAFDDVIGHTLGFFGLQICLTLVLLSNLAYHVSMKTLAMPVWLAILHAGFAIGTTMTKIIFATSVFADNPYYQVGEQASNRIAHFVDLAWMFFQALIPICLAYVARKHTTPCVFTIQNTQYWPYWKNTCDERHPDAPDTPHVDKKLQIGTPEEKCKDSPVPTSKSTAVPLPLSKRAPTVPHIYLPDDKETPEEFLTRFLPNRTERSHKFKYYQFTEKGMTLIINSESVRIFAYVAFWMMVIFAVIITYLSTTEEERDESLLVQTFGFNNICMYWDYSPSRELTAMFYPLVEVPLILYLFMNFLRKKQAFWAGQISRLQIEVEHFITPILVILAVWFRMIFVVSVFDSVVGHTLGFFGLQIALLLVLVSNFGYHFTHGSLVGGKKWAVFYLVVAFIVTVIKISLATSVFVGAPIYAVGTTGGNAFAHFIDICWMFLHAVCPCLYSCLNRKRCPDSVFHLAF